MAMVSSAVGWDANSIGSMRESPLSEDGRNAALAGMELQLSLACLREDLSLTPETREPEAAPGRCG